MSDAPSDARWDDRKPGAVRAMRDIATGVTSALFNRVADVCLEGAQLVRLNGGCGAR